MRKRESCMPRTMERAMGTGKIARAEGRFLLSARSAPDQHSKQNLAIVDQPFGPEIRRNRRRLNQAAELCRDRRKELRREEFRHSMGEGRFPEV